MDIPSAARDPVTITGYADDWMIFARHSDFNFIQCELQCTVSNMTKWNNGNSFRFSSTKTVCIHFCRLTNNDTAIINVTKHHKILGMIFDRKQQWGKHVEHVKTRAIKRLNFLNCLSRLRWGADCFFLLSNMERWPTDLQVKASQKNSTRHTIKVSEWIKI
jgi:hypothetical protein